MADITNRDDRIDSRDLIEALEDLEGQEGALIDEYAEAKEEADELAEETESEWQATERLTNAINALSDFWGVMPEEVADCIEAMADPQDEFKGLEELVILRNFAEQIEDASDYRHGLTLIRESDFIEYAKELAEDIGAIKENAEWPTCHIDWDAASDALQMDYSTAEFDGVTYYYRD